MRKTNSIRLSVYFLGFQFFTLFVNNTGWDSIGFAWPFWSIYVMINLAEQLYSHKFIFTKQLLPLTISLGIWLSICFGFMLFHYNELGLTKLCLYYLIGALFFLSILQANFSKKELEFILKMYSLMAICAAVLLLIQRVPVRNYHNRFSISIFGHIKDPNYFSAYLMFPALFFWNKFLSISTGYKSMFFALLVTVAVLLTGSRSSLLALSTGFLVLLAAEAKRNFFKIMFTLFCVGILGSFFLYQADLLTRFFDLSTYHDDSNRLRYSAWQAAVYIWKNNFLFGAGPQIVLNRGWLFGSLVPMMTHSTYLDVLAETGLVGLISFLSCPIWCFFRSARQNNLFVIACLVSTLSTSAIISAQYSQYYWVNLGLCFSLLTCPKLD